MDVVESMALALSIFQSISVKIACYTQKNLK